MNKLTAEQKDVILRIYGLTWDGPRVIRYDGELLAPQVSRTNRSAFFARLSEDGLLTRYVEAGRTRRVELTDWGREVAEGRWRELADIITFLPSLDDQVRRRQKVLYSPLLGVMLDPDE